MPSDLSRFRYDLDEGRLKGPRARAIVGALGLVGLSVVAYLVLANPPGGPSGWLAAVNVGGHSALLLVTATGVFERYFGQYVDLSLAHAEWRLPHPSTGNNVHCRVALARVRRVEVGVLSVEFFLDGGRRRSLPLGALPYTVVQEVKRRFAAAGPLRAVTGGELAARAARPA